MNKKIPQHIAIVMDGNGRWAESKGLSRIEGHKAGVDSVDTIVQACLKYGVSILSLFAFSSENWSRPLQEVEALMGLFFHALEDKVHELHKNGVSLRFSGSREGLSPLLLDKMNAAETMTAKNKDLILNLGINYGGRWDIIQAAKNLCQRVLNQDLSLDEITEASFTAATSTYPLPDPDLYIRTSGEQRISNFFLWQLAYTELYFTEVHWPDFDEAEFKRALNSFKMRDRRYGKLNGQEEKTHV